MEPKNSEYYMGNYELLPTIFQIKTNENIITHELPWDRNAEELCQAFYTSLIGIGFTPDGVLQSMEDFVNDHKPIDEGNYDIDNIEKVNENEEL